MTKPINKHKLCDSCPVNSGDGVSHYALKAIESVQNKESEHGPACCPYYVNSKIHGYCFWKFLSYEFEPINMQNISSLLCISVPEVKLALDSAIKKIKKGFEDDNPEIVDFIELIRNKIQMYDNVTDFAELPEGILQNIPKHDEEEEIEEQKKKKGRPKRTPLDMPIHRSGKRVDIYGLYSNKALERYHNDKKNKP